ncbi:MarR family winged helix-turn-helix transcriptional regulator [Alloscardovia venturai]|uniref:MarR family winged helix-turn-helix transcriptional regulator n=1 Tax=Alloscardovia venturai TaxID=1769421 RepID=A0ABW2Y4M8_9BIFI
MLVSRQPYFTRSRKFDSSADNSLRTLHMLDKCGQLTAGQIAEKLEVTPASVTQLIKKLEYAGTAERIKSEEDYRVTLVRLTDRGKNLLQTRAALIEQVQTELFDGFSDDDIHQLSSYLDQIIENVKAKDFRQHVTQILGPDVEWNDFDTMDKRLREVDNAMKSSAIKSEGKTFTQVFADAHQRWVRQSHHLEDKQEKNTKNRKATHA